jgi:hypothetical protein
MDGVEVGAEPGVEMTQVLAPGLMAQGIENVVQQGVGDLFVHLGRVSVSAQWREFDGRSWRYTILEQRNRIRKRLRNSPGLQARRDAILAEAYLDAVELAAKESGLAVAIFPQDCPYTWAEIMEDDFFPEGTPS